ncbi:glycine zipper 2TM domain-containing protein [Cellvibrio japonicus]|uniref:Glycine zipper 2TM domain-containing protein n=1 Tax=Cellvibrio japonicus (strain Ueda107) TaxID=498211 RepID=B3PKM7_CELJU|nr:hypothetical protein [Cellvibrio japonicus]ACE84613.1 conserved hypothetical protein [Cellvibrio japonicus Ueda107]QEI11438.1 hypothetical protein FY117_03805 [Cellvibrio japonicus]QEI15012.1 hypothetical protein FY116_03805 [Cellvibrio japonicus]QEI18592.1 hypothetical protein FY115_03805 [Cellvibrio japonicus]
MNKGIRTSLLIIALASLGTAFSRVALADHDRGYHKQKHSHHYRERVVVYERPIAYAPVVAARPIYRTVAVEVPVDTCRVETVAYRERRGGDSFGGTVVGGLIGAAIGYELGHSSGHAAAAGGVIGAAIGNSASGGGRTVTRYEDREVCQTRYRTEYERRLVGYDVSYSHNGRIYYTETTQHPGDRIRVDVSYGR